MLPRVDVANVVQPIASVEAATAIISVADTRQEAVSRLAQIAIGQQMPGRILSTFNDGTYLVRIANTAARMVLPANARTGDSLILTLVSKDPRPTFALQEGSLRQDDESAEVILSNAGRSMQKDLLSLQLAQRGGAGLVGENEQLPDAAAGKNAQPQQNQLTSSTTTLSQAGKLIDNLLLASQQGGASNHVTSPAPLVSGPNVGTQQMATALQNTITHSGVFYESHLSAWAEGKLPVEDLLKEPQSQAARLAGGTPSLLSQSDPSQSQLGQLLNLQLNALEQQKIVWHGQIWPGQQMEWEIGQDSSSSRQQTGTDDEYAPTWHSVVRFNFEHLGSVSASIRLVGQQIHVQINADNDITAAALRSNGNLFADAMSAAGTSLDSLSIRRDGPKAGDEQT